jgi:hypothetical protein
MFGSIAEMAVLDSFTANVTGLANLLTSFLVN